MPRSGGALAAGGLTRSVILTRDFVFVHIPKTGGNFVRAVLEDHAPADWQVERCEDHATWRDVPASHAELPKLAFVRNPFAWYVSWFHYQQKTRDPFFLEISDDGRLGFLDTMRRVYGTPWPGAAGRGQVSGDHSLPLGEGPFLQMLWDMLGPGLEGCRVGKMEILRDDLLRLLAELTTVPAALESAVLSLPAQNTSRHGHYSRYYDAELRDLVLARDRPIFDYFGYAWEEGPGD